MSILDFIFYIYWFGIHYNVAIIKYTIVFEKKKSLSYIELDGATNKNRMHQ